MREKAGYVYTVSESIDAARTRTVFHVSYGADAMNVAKALREIPPDQSSETRIAEGLLSRAVLGLPLDEPLRAAEKYKSLTAQQVQAAFAKWIRPHDFVEVVEGPPAK